MILYTEKQLQTAYILYVRELHKYNISNKLYVKIPTVEEFRLIYEEQMEIEYGSRQNQ